MHLREARTFTGRIIRGLLIGGGIAAGLLGIGAIRLLMRGGPFVMRPQDERVLAYYVTGCVLGSVVVSLIWPYLRTKVTRNAGFALGGTIFVASIFAESEGLRMDIGWWIMSAIVGSLAGVVIGNSWVLGKGPNDPL